MGRLLIMALTLVCFGAAASAEEIMVGGYDGSFWNSLAKVGSEEVKIPPGLSARTEAVVKAALDRDRKLARELASITKKVIVNAIYEGVIFGCADLGISKYYTKTTYEHLVKALDQFYADYRNEKVFVSLALQVIAMELRGEPSERVEERLRWVRNVASEAERKRP